MSEIGIIMKMNSMYEGLAKSEKKVVAYIVEHPEEVIRLSVTELAQNSGTSEATVVRTCRKIGMTGYQDLKVTLAQSLVAPIKSINEAITEEDSPAQIVQKVFHSSMQTLQSTLSVMNFDEVKNAADLLAEAKRVVVMALGNSSSLAMDLNHKLLRLGCSSSFSVDTHLQMIIACGIGPGDVLFAISHSGSSRDIVEAAKAWKKNGGSVISMTSIGITPLSKIANVSLVTASRETMFKLSALSSRIASMALIDSIYTLIAMSKRENIIPRFQKIEAGLREKKY